MRPLLTRMLLTGLMTLVPTTLAPAEALSGVNLPITVPLSGLQAAANAHAPSELARVEQTQSFLGGLLSVGLAGTVTRAGQVSVQPDGDALLVSLPIQAAFRDTPSGVGAGLARDFGGAATIRLRLTPYLTPNWEAGVKVSSDYAWTDPLSVDLGQGIKISVRSLVDSQIRAQLGKVSAQIEAAVRGGAKLRGRATDLWATVQRPWQLPLAGQAYALVKPVEVRAAPFVLTEGALKTTLGATFDLRAALGQAPAVTPAPLPALKVGDMPPSGAELSVPVALPFPELSRLASQYAAKEKLTLDVPTHPTVQVLGVTLKAAGTKVQAAVKVQISGPLGLRVGATVDVAGVPTLDAGGQSLSLKNVTVQTRREGLTGRVIGWLADARAQAYLTRAAHVDLSGRLAQARAEAQSRLPYSPTAGLTVSGEVGQLALTSLTVTPTALNVTAKASGKLSVVVEADKLKP